MKRINYLALFAILPLTTNTYAAPFTQTIQHTNFKSLTANNDDQLGAGYFDNSIFPIHNRCIKNMPIKVSNFQSSVLLSNRTNMDQLSRNLNVEIKAKAGWGKFSSNAATNYIKSIQDDEYSINFTYQNVITVDTTLDTSDYYGIDALNLGGSAAYTKSTDAFIARCGDKYLKNTKMGAVLNVTLRVRFASQLQKKNFEASIGGKIGDLFNASAKISEAAKNNAAHGTIDVIAFQTGGDASNLSAIFGADDEHPIIRCNLEKLEECTKTIDNIFSYAQATGKWKDSGFTKQIQIVDGTLATKNLSPVALSDAIYGAYEYDFGLNVPIMPATNDIMDARKKLNILYEKMESNLHFVNSLIQSTGYRLLSNVLQEKIKITAKDIEGNLTIFTTEKALDCFLPNTQKHCSEIAENIESKMDPIDLTSLNLLKGAYYVNINQNWPSIFVDNSHGSFEFYTTQLTAMGTTTHDLKLTPSYDYQFLSLGGGYSYYYNGNHIRYYMDSYGAEDLIYKNALDSSYVGTVPWNTCVNGNCYKAYYPMEIVPF